MSLPSGEHSERIRYVVQMKQLTYPNGEKLTRSFIPFDVEGRGHTPNSDTINEILPRVDDEYRLLIQECKEEGISKSLDQFFEHVSDIAVVGEGLREMLALDTGTNIAVVEKALTETQWFKSTSDYIQKESGKARKKDPIRYAESVRQITDVFGHSKAATLFARNGIRLKKSAIGALRRIANETPTIKRLVSEGKLKLTVAFELPSIEESEREKIAERLAELDSYSKQKQLLGKIRARL
jgi:hypothetical protein